MSVMAGVKAGRRGGGGRTEIYDERGDKFAVLEGLEEELCLREKTNKKKN